MLLYCTGLSDVQINVWSYVSWHVCHKGIVFNFHFCIHYSFTYTFPEVLLQGWRSIFFTGAQPRYSYIPNVAEPHLGLTDWWSAVGRDAVGAKVLGMHGVFLRMTSLRWVSEETITVDPDLVTGKSHQGNVLEHLGTSGQSLEGLLIWIAEPSGVARGLPMGLLRRSLHLCSCHCSFPEQT